ncbi:lytic polysaccharide monooxygenase [Stemphylium lycopersici]|uniref:Lytic polysaccharide monooxygenase n=1 Tax=Stemphylium lycopersici TaxID=183478 RepID=A0A364NFU6_STELY|nr:lytic polysaccharide monooxygenase [Stemphylium lycopersici]RAR16178.1 lytic polysaccharide monooxygenase [Stemphylium lycopersici]
MFSQATILLGLTASAAAHMIMDYPVPFGKATLNSSPLAPADYPCKQRSGVYDITEMNQWNAGETKTISFTGSAVHGGGSCQFSITTDPEPSESSQWKVIQSVVGGCPSNVTGNLEPSDPNGHGAATFPVEMPKSIPDGQYTFAWTWLNKVGNREFYMNCAPIQVGSGSAGASTKSVASALSTLPDMFVANLPDTSCSTAQGEDFNYPNPGQNLIEGNGASLGDTLSGAGCDKMTKMGAGNGQIGTPTQPDASVPASSEAPAATSGYGSQPEASAPVYSQAPAATSGYGALPSNGGGVFAPGASSAPAVSAPAASTPAAEPTAPTYPTPTEVASAPSSAPETPDNSYPSAPSGDADCTPCDNDGAVVCIGTNQFGLCNRGCAVAQPLAYGMSCSGGAVVASAKRSLQFPRAHLHRRHGSSRFV